MKRIYIVLMFVLILIPILNAQIIIVKPGGDLGNESWNQSFADDLFVLKAGDTMTGLLTVDQNADAKGIYIDSEATTASNYPLHVNAPTTTSIAAFITDGDANSVVIGHPGYGDGTLRVYRNFASASTTGPVASIIQDNAGDDQAVLKILQDGEDYGIEIDMNQDDHAAIYADITGATMSLGDITHVIATYLFDRDVASATSASPVFMIRQDNAGDDQDALSIQNDGTGVAIALSGAGNQSITGVECITFASGGKICSGT